MGNVLIERGSTVFAIRQDRCHNSVLIMQVSTPKAIFQTWATMVQRRLQLSSSSLVPYLPWVCDYVIILLVMMYIVYGGGREGEERRIL